MGAQQKAAETTLQRFGHPATRTPGESRPWSYTVIYPSLLPEPGCHTGEVPRIQHRSRSLESDRPTGLSLLLCKHSPMQRDSLGPHVPLTCAGGCTVGMGWSKDVKADMADISTSSLTKMFPCTRVWIKGDGGTVMYVEIC